ncbi:hypothetical protein CCR97_25345 [Rhodoplanes elegans]|uniref:Uncharacterized protein n=1 Tax=Rhodoplanes elegans TaxID=29408 RepID=A0A327K8D1_9BRAD|nr:hypothetical protein [Rhodoplanes elegans]MBK5961506.1 hypothetical protein [Rhodoplanes elegans]RAI34176.1 hypothetical protein CH338_21350 [Rhodoplanes elegans]
MHRYVSRNSLRRRPVEPPPAPHTELGTTAAPPPGPDLIQAAAATIERLAAVTGERIEALMRKVGAPP